MGVEILHEDYKANESAWTKEKHAFDGEDAIKAEGSSYLPRLSGQTDNEYQSYKKRAVFPEVTSRTILGQLGQVFRRQPDAELDKIEDISDDIDLAGTPLNQFAFDVVLQVLLFGRCGVLADYSTSEGRPYLALYPPLSIVNWREERIDGNIIPTLIVLAEQQERPSAEDEYKSDAINMRRVLRLVDGVYEVELWEDTSGQANSRGWVQVESGLQPTRFGSRLDEIPFVCVGPFGHGLGVQKSPSLPLVNLNLSLYRTSADLENGRHFCGCPTPWITGVREDEGPFRIGAPEAWIFSDADAKIGMLEFTGQGLGALEKAIEEKLQMMASMGARMMVQQKRAAETAESKRIDAASETSTLSAIVDNVSRALTRSLGWCNAWTGGQPENVSFELNRDFWVNRLSPQDLTALVAAWQSGAFDHETLLYNLREGEALPPDVTNAEILEKIDMQAPAMSSPNNFDA